MAIHPHQFVQPLRIGTVKRFGKFLAAVDGTIVSLWLKSDNPAIGSVTFDIRKNGVTIYDDPGDRPVFTTGMTEVLQTGLDVEVEEMDVITAHSTNFSSFASVGASMYMQINIDDGAEVQGPQGEPGPAGADGAPGAVGPQGTDGISAFARQTINFVTGSLADDAEAEQAIPLGITSMVFKITADRECRLRMYATDAHRDADLARPIGTAPSGEHGLLLEAIFVTGNLALIMSPIPTIANIEDTPTDNIPSLVQNLSGGTSTVALDFVVTQLEVE